MQKIYKFSVLIIFLVGAKSANASLSGYPTLLKESIDEKTIFLSNQFHATGSSFTYINRMQLSAQQELGFTTYPNPVTNHTTISYLLPSKSNVVLKLVDLAGKRLAVLFQKEQGAGLQEYHWELSKNKITSGMYILVLQVNKLSYTKKIIVQ
jgi:hypothetical protein